MEPRLFQKTEKIFLFSITSLLNFLQKVRAHPKLKEKLPPFISNLAKPFLENFKRWKIKLELTAHKKSMKPLTAPINLIPTFSLIAITPPVIAYTVQVIQFLVIPKPLKYVGKLLKMIPA